MSGRKRRYPSAQQHLRALRTRPIVEFIGGPRDGVRLPIASNCRTITFRHDAEDGSAAVVDTYVRDLIEPLKFYHQGRKALDACPGPPDLHSATQPEQTSQRPE